MIRRTCHLNRVEADAGDAALALGATQVCAHSIGASVVQAANYAFIDHFQEVARAHFVVRRLERRYGKSAVRTAYERFCCETEADA